MRVSWKIVKNHAINYVLALRKEGRKGGGKMGRRKGGIMERTREGENIEHNIKKQWLIQNNQTNQNKTL